MAENERTQYLQLFPPAFEFGPYVPEKAQSVVILSTYFYTIFVELKK
jgi:hypothetical protein